MAIDQRCLTRRQVLSAVALGGLATGPGRAVAGLIGSAAPAASQASVRCVAAAWDDVQGQHHVGILRITPGGVAVQASVEVPIRAHALVSEPGGSMLVVARRPGEWLLRWHPPGFAGPDASAARDHGVMQWFWVDDDYRFNGHMVVSPDGNALLTTETDQHSGDGLLVRRDRKTMQVTHRWATGGVDPHAMHFLPQGLLLVANGGVAARPETGRTALNLDHMDSSLVAMSAEDGRVHKVWRLADRRLSLRHLAWHPGGQMAVAMQAQHADAAQRANAPVLALLDLQRSELRAVDASRGLGGYAGDVATVGAHWFISCPRVDTVLRMALDGSGATRLPLADACALATASDRSWGWAAGGGGAMPLQSERAAMRLDWSPDNHAIVL